MDANHLILHGLAIKKHARPEDINGLIGLSLDDVALGLVRAVASGRAVEADQRYMLTPLARVALGFSYSRFYAAERSDPSFFAAYETFERINLQLKALITDWQTIVVGGKPLRNDHSDTDYDDKIIDRLGDLHEQSDDMLAALERTVPRLGYYRRNLLSALEKAEDGAIEWVSDATIESYHTLWFELHEDLLRIVGRTRVE